MSVADNIRIGRPEASAAEIVAAARASRAHDFIHRLPQGYDTVLGENALRLSVGQAQRIALARAFVRGARLYIFDEATANLDSENETAIQKNLEALTAGATVRTIAHRLQTIRDADRIVVLDGGCITEIGAHDELIRRRGAYFQLLQMPGDEVYV